MKRYTAEERAVWRGEMEYEAVNRLCRFLEDQGESAIVTSRPDEQIRDRPAVDFELAVNGRAVGLEITQLLPAARSRYESTRITRHISQALTPDVQARKLGLLALEWEYNVLPSANEIEAEVEGMIERIRTGIDGLQSGPVSQTGIELGDTPIANNIRLRQLSSDDHRIAFIVESDDWGGRIQPMAEEFVDHLLLTKPAQTHGWDEAWIAVVDRSVLVDAVNVAEAFASRRAEIPRNWRRIYFLPAVSGAGIVDVFATLTRANGPQPDGAGAPN